MALFVRFRQGTRVDVETSPFDALQEFLCRVANGEQPREAINAVVRNEVWDTLRPDATSTWFAILNEFFRLYGEDARPEVQAAQLRVLEALAPGGTPAELWQRTLPAVIERIDLLSGWAFSPERLAAESWNVQRAVRIIGARTVVETKLEYLEADASRRYGHLHQTCRLISLFTLFQDFQQDPGRYPETIRVTLPEGAYIFFSWYHLMPMRSPRVPWRPPNRFCEPEVLAAELIARYAESYPLPLPAAAPEVTSPHGEFHWQHEVAVDTDLRIGEDDEGLIAFRDRQLRWINGTREYCPIVIIGVQDINDYTVERRLTNEFLGLHRNL